MVCSGNICRSPMAEAVLRTRLAAAGVDGVEVDSFGTGSWHVGQAADRRARKALRSAGYDISHTARMISVDELAERDLVVAMDRGHLDALRELAHRLDHPPPIRLLSSFARGWPGDDEDVPDPYYGDAADYEHVLELVEAGADGLVAYLRRR